MIGEWNESARIADLIRTGHYPILALEFAHNENTGERAVVIAYPHPDDHDRKHGRSSEAVDVRACDHLWQFDADDFTRRHCTRLHCEARQRRDIDGNWKNWQPPIPAGLLDLFNRKPKRTRQS